MKEEESQSKGSGRSKIICKKDNIFSIFSMLVWLISIYINEGSICRRKTYPDLKLFQKYGLDLWESGSDKGISTWTWIPKATLWKLNHQDQTLYLNNYMFTA